jgi:hypothetical protein
MTRAHMTDISRGGAKVVYDEDADSACAPAARTGYFGLTDGGAYVLRLTLGDLGHCVP